MKTLMKFITVALVVVVSQAFASMSQADMEKIWAEMKETNAQEVWRVWQTFDPNFNLEQWHREIQYLFPDGGDIPIFVNNKRLDYHPDMKFDNDSDIVVMLRLGHKFAPFSQEYTEAYTLGNWYSCKEEALAEVRKKYPNESSLGDDEVLKKYKFVYGELCMTKILPRPVKPTVEEVSPSNMLIDWLNENVVILCSLLAIFATGGYLFTTQTKQE